MEAWDTLKKKDWNQTFRNYNNSVWYGQYRNSRLNTEEEKISESEDMAMKTIQNETQGKKRKDLWSSLCFCLLRSSVLQTLASFISDSQVHVLKLRESFSLHFSDLSLCQTLDSLPKQGLEQSYWLPYSFPISQRRLSSIAWYPVSWKLLFHVIHSVFWLFQQTNKSSTYYHTLAIMEVNFVF